VCVICVVTCHKHVKTGLCRLAAASAGYQPLSAAYNLSACYSIDGNVNVYAAWQQEVVMQNGETDQ
jgi:hypothetical protein